MLNFKFGAEASAKIGVEVKQIQYPLIFDGKNVCIHCGAEGSLVFVDRFGNQTKKAIYPLDYLHCEKCGRDYSILWNRDDHNNRMYPSATEMGIKQEFFNLINYPSIRKEGVKQIGE